MYIKFRCEKSKSLVTSIALQQIREADVVFTNDIKCMCKTQWYTIATLGLVILGIVILIVIHTRKLKLFRGYMFSNAVKIMLCISYTQYYVPVKLCRTAGSIHLFKITGKLTPEQITLKRKLLWDIVELDWKDVNMTLNGNGVHLPNSVIIPLRDKLKIRCFIRREPLLPHIMLRQGMTWFSLENSREDNAIPETA